MSKAKTSKHLPHGWIEESISLFCKIYVGKDLREECFSKKQSETYKYPVYSNSVEDKGLYGFYSLPEFTGTSLTVVGRGAGLGTAFTRFGGFGAIGRLLVLFPKESAYVHYLTEYINSRIRFFVESSGIPQLTGEQIGKYTIPLPPLPVQIAIADILSMWNIAIEKTEHLIASKEKQYSWLLSNFISNAKYEHGHIRDIASEMSTRNNSAAIDLVLSVTNNRGFVLPEDQFERRVASSDLNNYKVVMRGQYAYNPSRINVGSIARLDAWDVGVLSPMYTVFELNEQKVDTDYFLHWLESHEAKQRIRKSAQGSVRETVSFTDFGAIAFPLPSLDKQRKIAAILNSAHNEIDLLKKQLEAYRKQKRGLMQKLLTGQWRVKIDGTQTTDHIE